MRRINYIMTFLMLPLFVSLPGCEDSNVYEEGEIGIVEEGIILNFNAETETAGGAEFSGPSEPVIIMEGESVIFVSTSVFKTEYSDGTVDMLDLSGATSWVFEGGSPIESLEGIETVVYNTAGKYKVTIRARGPLSFSDEYEELIVMDYVTVVAKEPEAICLIETATFSDGREAIYIYNDMDMLIRSDKSLNGILQEYSLYQYDEGNRLEQEQFHDASGNLLGTIGYEHNSDNQLTSESTEDANGILIRNRLFNWDGQDFINNAMYQEPDGLGGLINFDVEIVYDSDKKNITGEIFYQNGVEVGRNIYEFDTHPYMYTGQYIETSPLKFNTNNPTAITTLDANGTVVDEQTKTYEYSDILCGPIRIDHLAPRVTQLAIRQENTYKISFGPQ